MHQPRWLLINCLLASVAISACSDQVSVRKTEASCGNASIETGEQCDDGNNINTDACTNACETARCGDGILYALMESCDDGNQSQSDSCLNNCKQATCGDGFLRVGVEVCDASIPIYAENCDKNCQKLSSGVEQKKEAVTIALPVMLCTPRALCAPGGPQETIPQHLTSAMSGSGQVTILEPDDIYGLVSQKIPKSLADYIQCTSSACQAKYLSKIDDDAVGLVLHTELRETDEEATLYLTFRHTERRGVIAKEILNAQIWQELSQSQIDSAVKALFDRVIDLPDETGDQFGTEDEYPDDNVRLNNEVVSSESDSGDRKGVQGEYYLVPQGRKVVRDTTQVNVVESAGKPEGIEGFWRFDSPLSGSILGLTGKIYGMIFNSNNSAKIYAADPAGRIRCNELSWTVENSRLTLRRVLEDGHRQQGVNAEFSELDTSEGLTQLYSIYQRDELRIFFKRVVGSLARVDDVRNIVAYDGLAYPDLDATCDTSVPTQTTTQGSTKTNIVSETTPTDSESLSLAAMASPSAPDTMDDLGSLVIEGRPSGTLITLVSETSGWVSRRTLDNTMGSGAINFRWLKPGKYNILAEKRGYKSRKFRGRIQAGKLSRLRISMERKTTRFQE